MKQQIIPEEYNGLLLSFFVIFIFQKRKGGMGTHEN
jgi:hypothetical protein